MVKPCFSVHCCGLHIWNIPRPCTRVMCVLCCWPLSQPLRGLTTNCPALHSNFLCQAHSRNFIPGQNLTELTDPWLGDQIWSFLSHSPSRRPLGMSLHEFRCQRHTLDSQMSLISTKMDLGVGPAPGHLQVRGVMTTSEYAINHGEGKVVWQVLLWVPCDPHHSLLGYTLLKNWKQVLRQNLYANVLVEALFTVAKQIEIQMPSGWMEKQQKYDITQMEYYPIKRNEALTQGPIEMKLKRHVEWKQNQVTKGHMLWF